MNDPILGHNGGPALDDRTTYERIRDEIDDILIECRNFTDGDPIGSQEMADAITQLHDRLSEAGKRADDERVKEKEPFDTAAKEVQERFNKLIGNTKTTGKGKVVLGKEVLQSLLTPWRNKVAEEKEAAAKAAREEADRIQREAEDAIRASSGNLEEREKAEELLKEAKQIDRWAKREDKAATTGTGLRSIWHCEMVDEGKALDWAYARAPEQFRDVVQKMAEETVRGGMRSVPGFTVREERVAR